MIIWSAEYVHSAVGKAVAGLAIGIVVIAVGARGAVVGAPEGLLALALSRPDVAVSGVPRIRVARACCKQNYDLSIIGCSFNLIHKHIMFKMYISKPVYVSLL